MAGRHSDAQVGAIESAWRVLCRTTARAFGVGFGSCLVLALVTLGLLAGQLAPLLRTARHDVLAAWSQVNPPQANTADFVPIHFSSGNPYGVNTFLYQEVEDTKIRLSLAAIKSAGFGFIREQVAWQEFERGQKNSYWDERWQRSSWTNLDRLVRLVQEYGLQMVARVDYPPDWALPPGQTWHASPPADFADYGDFVYTLASRYRGQIKYYQVWNEPNLTIEWGQKPVDPAEYVRLLRVAYQRIKEADPQAVVIAAALAPTIEQGPLNLSDLDYLRQMYEAGAKDYFDIASVNPYGLRSGPDDRSLAADDTNFSRPIQAREIMVQYGDAAKPIWASETGWCALPPEYPLPPEYGRTTLAQQGAYTARGYERVLREWPWLGAMFLWHFRMVDNRLASQQAYYFGILGDDFSANPVYEDLKAAASAPPLLYPGFRQEDNRALNYSGQWSVQGSSLAAGGALELAASPGDRVSGRFWGSELTLVARRGPGAGSLRVTIDGLASTTDGPLRADGGGASLDLQSRVDEWQALLPLARGLSLGEHAFDLEVVTVGQGVAIDGFLVEAQSERSPLPLLIGLGLGLVAMFVVVRLSRRK